MKRIWMVKNSDNDIHFFDDDKHLEESVRITFSSCTEVYIEREQDSSMNVTFSVDFKRPGEEDLSTEVIVARCFPVWDSPSHL